MSSIPSDFLTKIFNTIDSVIGNFVQSTYHNLISNNLGTITFIFTLYVIVLGYRFLMDNSYSSDIGTVTRHLIFVSIVYGLVVSWGFYNRLVYDVFTNEPERISTIVVNSSGQSIPGGSVLQALDSVWSSGMDAALKLFNKAGIDSLQFIFYGATVFLVTLFMSLFALGLFLYSKIAMAIALGLSPIFIILSLFNSTKGFTQSWIQHLFNFALIPIVTSAVIAIMYSTINTTLGGLEPGTGIETDFTAIISYSLVLLGAVFLLFQVLPICSGLAGGVTLTSIESGIRTAYRALKGEKNSNGGGDKPESGKGNSKSGNSKRRNRKREQIQKMRQQNRANAASKSD